MGKAPRPDGLPQFHLAASLEAPGFICSAPIGSIPGKSDTPDISALESTIKAQ
jgi:hypothetical protein